MKAKLYFIMKKFKSVISFFILILVLFVFTKYVLVRYSPFDKWYVATSYQVHYIYDVIKLNYPRYGFSWNTLTLTKRIEDDCNINLKQDSQEKIALALMDFVFRTTKRGHEDNIPCYQRYLLASSAPPLTQVCSGYANELLFLLNKSGIPNRKIYLAAPSYFKQSNGDTHTITEAYLNEKWVVLDPTFNLYWNCSNGKKMLSLHEMNVCLQSGNILIPQEEKSKIHGYSISKYYISMNDLMYAYQYVGPIYGKWSYFNF